MRMHDIEMTILVKNRPIFEYEHNNQFFIEGRAGSNYEIELRNHTNTRVEAILSVDGLSVIDGKEAGPNSRSYMIESRGTLRIPGWLLDSGNAAKFAFAGKQDSYASQSGNEAQNVGVIGALIYREKPATPVMHLNWPMNYPYTWPTVGGTSIPQFYHTTSNTRGSVSSNTINSNIMTSGASSAAAASSPFIGASFNATAAPTAAQSDAAANIQQGLGTAFGDQMAFATRTVAFERGDQIAIMTLFYDNMRGLRARGVPVERRKKQFAQPNAFPGLTGCTPPPNWRVSGSASR